MLAVRRNGHPANPLLVGVNGPDLAVLVGVPPDQSAVVTAGDDGLAGQDDGGDVTVVLADLLERLLGLIRSVS